MRGFEKLEAQSHEPCSFESGRKSLKEKKRKVKKPTYQGRDPGTMLAGN
jgi:hypothetical protein